MESELGKGARFHFTIQLPLSNLNASELSAETSTATLKGIKVLIVDDNAASRRILGTMLESWGMKCVAMETGEEALRELSNALGEGVPYSLILTDLAMPVMDGFKFVEMVRNHREFSSTTILVLTCIGQRGDGSRCRELGVAAYLLKPVRQSELLAAVRRALGGGPASSEQQLITRYSLLGAAEPTASLRILLAEDNAVNQKLAGRLLKKRHHRVVFAANGHEVLKRFEDGTFDLILMDVQMPEMDGLEATTAIRQLEQREGRHRTPVIALTAHAMKGDRERCLAVGMDGYLAKPLRPVELDEMLAKYLTGQKEKTVALETAMPLK